jgi:hypothetical protein
MLFKYSKGLRDVYIYDFVEAIKMFMSKFYEVYYDHECKFRDESLGMKILMHSIYPFDWKT